MLKNDFFKLNCNAGGWSLWRPKTLKSLLWETVTLNRVHIFRCYPLFLFYIFYRNHFFWTIMLFFYSKKSFHWTLFVTKNEMLLRNFNKNALIKLIEGYSTKKYKKTSEYGKLTVVFIETTCQCEQDLTHLARKLNKTIS